MNVFHKKIIKKRTYNTSRIRKNSIYDIKGICDLFSLHKNTVREWIRNGLQVIDKKRPVLIKGTDLKLFLENRQKSQKKKCALNEFFCMRCKCPRKAKDNLLTDLSLHTPKKIMLTGFCEHCGVRLKQIKSINDLQKLIQAFDIQKHQLERLSGSSIPSLNCYIRGGTKNEELQLKQ